MLCPSTFHFHLYHFPENGECYDYGGDFSNRVLQMIRVITKIDVDWQSWIYYWN